jgi:hypothetical protein
MHAKRKENAMKTNRKNNETSREAYARQQKDIANLMEWLQIRLREDAAEDFDAKNWADVGTLAHVREQLVHTLAFMANVEDADIERMLAK